MQSRVACYKFISRSSHVLVPLTETICIIKIQICLHFLSFMIEEISQMCLYGWLFIGIRKRRVFSEELITKGAE